MGTVPSPYSPVAGDDATQARVLTWADAALYQLGNATSGGSRRPVALMTQTVAQSLPNVVSTAVTYDNEVYDYDNGHSTVTNPQLYTVNTAGVYLFIFGVSFVANVTGMRQAWLYKASASVHLPTRACVPSAGATFATGVTNAVEVAAAAGDTFQVFAQQNSTAALNTSVSAPDQSMFAVYWLSV